MHRAALRPIVHGLRTLALPIALTVCLLQGAGARPVYDDGGSASPSGPLPVLFTVPNPSLSRPAPARPTSWDRPSVTLISRPSVTDVQTMLAAENLISRNRKDGRTDYRKLGETLDRSGDVRLAAAVLKITPYRNLWSLSPVVNAAVNTAEPEKLLKNMNNETLLVNMEGELKKDRPSPQRDALIDQVNIRRTDFVFNKALTAGYFTDEDRAKLKAMGSSAEAPLIHGLTNESVRVRCFAAGMLGDLGGTQSVDPLIKTLNEDSDATTRAMAANALGAIGDPRAVPALIDALHNDPDSYARLQAIGALSKINDPRVVEGLLWASGDSHPSINQQAKDGLINIGDTEVAGLLQEAIAAETDAKRRDRMQATEDELERRIALRADFKKNYGIDVVDAKDKRFSTYQMENMYEVLQNTDPSLLKGLKTIEAETGMGVCGRYIVQDQKLQMAMDQMFLGDVSFQKVFSHELGHSVDLVAEGYTQGKGTNGPTTYPMLYDNSRAAADYAVDPERMTDINVYEDFAQSYSCYNEDSMREYTRAVDQAANGSTVYLGKVLFMANVFSEGHPGKTVLYDQYRQAGTVTVQRDSTGKITGLNDRSVYNADGTYNIENLRAALNITGAQPAAPTPAPALVQWDQPSVLMPSRPSATEIQTMLAAEDLVSQYREDGQTDYRKLGAALDERGNAQLAATALKIVPRRSIWLLSPVPEAADASAGIAEAVALLDTMDNQVLLGGIAGELKKDKPSARRDALIEEVNVRKVAVILDKVKVEDGLHRSDYYALAAMGSEAEVPLIRALSNDNVRVRRYAAVKLGEMGGARSVDALSKMLVEDPDASARAAAAVSLGGIGDPGAVPALDRALRNDTDANVRGNAIESLAGMDDPRVMDSLLWAAGDDQPSVSKCARDGLMNIGDAAVAEPLRRAAANEPDAQRRGRLDAVAGEIEHRVALRAGIKKEFDVDVVDSRNNRFTTCQLEQMYATLKNTDPSLLRGLETIETVRGSGVAGLYYAGDKKIQIASDCAMSDEFFAAVFAHEFGHSVDHRVLEISAGKMSNGPVTYVDLHNSSNDSEDFPGIPANTTGINVYEDFATGYSCYSKDSQAEYSRAISQAANGSTVYLDKVLFLTDVFTEGHPRYTTVYDDYRMAGNLTVKRDRTGKITGLNNQNIYNPDGSYNLQHLRTALNITE